MIKSFKEAMAKTFDMGLMSYFLDLEVKQGVDSIFMTQEQYAKEVLKRFRMNDCNPVNAPVDCGTKLSKSDEGKTVDPTHFKSLVGSLRYLTCTRPDILYGVGLVSRFMKEPKETHWKTAKRILRYVRVRKQLTLPPPPPDIVCTESDDNGRTNLAKRWRMMGLPTRKTARGLNDGRSRLWGRSDL
ncbi:hypothetical protein ZIOFF_052238 [Zingiber officinale]|uniref:Reverse transcriptase Ty1/copia-type domain-containing protein n=1 Tax=Zingiber officinale TaxID=94328 RepID=A0A8J5KND5_ZINOF|nr:hypothetical protein ZIOFF_052238 [Zingiber officinale]